MHHSARSGDEIRHLKICNKGGSQRGELTEKGKIIKAAIKGGKPQADGNTWRSLWCTWSIASIELGPIPVLPFSSSLPVPFVFI